MCCYISKWYKRCLCYQSLPAGTEWGYQGWCFSSDDINCASAWPWEMKISALLTSAGINIGLCVLFLSLYSVLRKQPANVRVYFGRRIAEENERLRGAFILERFVPSTGWIVKALQCTEEEILAAAGLDAVVFNRILVFRYGVQNFRFTSSLFPLSSKLRACACA